MVKILWKEVKDMMGTLHRMSSGYSLMKSAVMLLLFSIFLEGMSKSLLISVENLKLNLETSYEKNDED